MTGVASIREYVIIGGFGRHRQPEMGKWVYHKAPKENPSHLQYCSNLVEPARPDLQSEGHLSDHHDSTDATAS